MFSSGVSLDCLGCLQQRTLFMYSLGEMERRERISMWRYLRNACLESDSDMKLSRSFQLLRCGFSISFNTKAPACRILDWSLSERLGRSRAFALALAPRIIELN
jgi:hypothetical protein